MNTLFLQMYSPMRQLLVRVAVLVGIGTASGCQSDGVITVSTPRSRVVLNVPGGEIDAITASPDGAVFVGVEKQGLYRRYPADSESWEKVASPNVTLLSYYAPSRSTLFAIQRMSGVVHRWDAGVGFRAMQTPLADSVAVFDHVVAPVALTSLWGRGPNDVYAVGNYAAVMHFDGRSWSLESNPLIRHAFVSTRSVLWSVGGDTERTFAAGTLDLIRRSDRGWESIEAPTGDSAIAWYLTARLGDGTLVVGRKRATSELQAFQLVRENWRSLSDALRGVRGTINAGATQPDSSVLFWTDVGELVHVASNRKVTIYTRLPLDGIRGAAFVEGRLYVAGRAHERAFVLLIQKH